MCVLSIRGTDKYILDGVSFRMDAGRHYAFVGINGSGKTTITKLMTGLYDDFEGEILINGRNISEYSQSEIKALFFTGLSGLCQILYFHER